MSRASFIAFYHGESGPNEPLITFADPERTIAHGHYLYPDSNWFFPAIYFPKPCPESIQMELLDENYTLLATMVVTQASLLAMFPPQSFSLGGTP